MYSNHSQAVDDDDMITKQKAAHVMCLSLFVRRAGAALFQHYGEEFLKLLRVLQQVLRGRAGAGAAAREELLQWIESFVRDSSRAEVWRWGGLYPHILKSILEWLVMHVSMGDVMMIMFMMMISDDDDAAAADDDDHHMMMMMMMIS
jgi:hypothetical protein